MTVHTSEMMFQAEHPCMAHKNHDPVCIRTELHHVFPLYLQTQVWPDVQDNPARARDTERVPLCSTGHENVHLAIKALLEEGALPSWCRGTIRDLAADAVDRLNKAKATTE